MLQLPAAPAPAAAKREQIERVDSVADTLARAVERIGEVLEAEVVTIKATVWDFALMKKIAWPA